MLAVLNDVALAAVAERHDAKASKAIIPEDSPVLSLRAFQSRNTGDVDGSRRHDPALRFAPRSPHGKHGKHMVSEIRPTPDISGYQGKSERASLSTISGTE